MLDCLRFILKCVADFSKMLFTINLGNGLNMGLLMCIIFIFLPIVYRVICFIKQDAMEELNDRYEESRPRESHYAEFHESAPFRNGYISYSHSISKSRRRRR